MLRAVLAHARNRTLFLVGPQLLLVPTTTAANLPATLLSLDSAPQADVFVPNELPDDIHPTLVRGQIVVEFVRNLIQRGQPSPGHGWEVVMFVVQPNVVGEKVEYAIVGVCFRDGDLVRLVQRLLVGLLEYVVLSDEVSCAWVQRPCQEAAQNHVSKCLPANKLYERIIEDDLSDDVE